MTSHGAANLEQAADRTTALIVGERVLPLSVILHGQ